VNQPSQIQPAEPTRERLLGRLAIALSEVLVREFEEIVVERADHAAAPEACPLGQSAEAAQRISLLCRQLRIQAERFERFDRMCDEAEVDRQPEPDDLPF
jgi:hypothetical protein